MSNSDEQKKVKITGAPQLSDMILGSLKPRVGKETTKWVAGLTDEAMEAAEQAAQMESVNMLTSSDKVPPKPPQMTTIPFMDYLFDCFQQYEFEFNRSAPGPDFIVSIERPVMVTETLRSKLKAPETKQIFRGRISTRSWTLLLRGHQDSMEGWILPIEQLISFAGDHSQFTQFLDMRAEVRGADTVWSVDGVEVTWDKIRSFAKQLFAALIHVSKTNMQDGLVFTLKPKKPSKSTADLATAAKETPSYSFDEHNPEFEGLSTAGTKPAVTSTPRAAQVPVNARSPNAVQGVAVQGVAAQGAPTQVGSNQASAASTGVATTGTAPGAVAVGTGSFDAVIDALQIVFNYELEKLSAAGQDAFARQDMATVEKIFQRTTRVKQLRDEATAQTKSWKAALKQALDA